MHRFATETNRCGKILRIVKRIFRLQINAYIK